MKIKKVLKKIRNHCYESDCVSCPLYEKPEDSSPGKWCSFCYPVYALDDEDIKMMEKVIHRES